MEPRPLVAIVGGPDVDARIPLVEELRSRFSFVVFGSDAGKRTRFAEHEIPFRHYPLTRRVSPLGDLRAIRELHRAFEETRPSVVHAFDTKPGIYACIAARRAGVPVATSTITGLGSLYSSEGPKTRLLRAIYEGLQRIACRKADYTVFQNHDDERRLLAAGVATKGKTAVVLGSGVDTRTFDPHAMPADTRERTRTSLGIAPDAVVVTMVSRMTRTKGALEFAELARRCADAGPRVRFLAVGPDDRDSVDRLTPRELGELQAAVLWTGARSDVREILAASDVFVLPSACREGIPRSLLEAASTGLPLVTTDTPGCNEACRDGENGFCVAEGDADALARAVRRLVVDEGLRRAFGAASRRRARERFDLRVVASQMARIWEDRLAAVERAQLAQAASSPHSNIMSR